MSKLKIIPITACKFLFKNKFNPFDLWKSLKAQLQSQPSSHV